MVDIKHGRGHCGQVQAQEPDQGHERHQEEPGADPHEPVPVRPGELHFFPEMETFSFRSFFALKKILKTKRYDIIHDVQSLGWGTIPMKGYNIPIVTTVHHPLTKDREADLSNNFGLWDKTTTILFYPLVMQAFVIRRIDRVITSFKEGVDELYNAFRIKKDKVSVVYNGMDIEMFQNTGEKNC